MRSVEQLREALANANVRAFQHVIRHGESSHTDDAYRMLFGGGLFDSFADHPRVYFDLPDGRRTSPAGAYQIVVKTWDNLRKRRPGVYTDFTPATQDLACVDLLDSRKALDDVLAGNVEQAIGKLRDEWTSLPGAFENSGRYTMDRAKQVFAQYGGGEAVVAEQEPAPVEDREAVNMPAPLAVALIPALVDLAVKHLPTFFSLMNQPGKASRERNIELGVKALEVVQEAVNTVVPAANAQAAVEAVATNPQARSAAEAALRANYFDLLKFQAEQEQVAFERTEKSTADARAFTERITDGDESTRKIRALGYAILMAILAFGIIFGGGGVMAYLATSLMKSEAPQAIALVNKIVDFYTAVGYMVVGFVFGSSYSSRMKDDTMSQIVRQKGA